MIGAGYRIGTVITNRATSAPVGGASCSQVMQFPQKQQTPADNRIGTVITIGAMSAPIGSSFSQVITRQA